MITYAFYAPFLMSMAYSFMKWNGISSAPVFIGLKNFVDIFTKDTTFAPAAVFTVAFAGLYVLITNALALVLAVVLDKQMKSANLLRTVFFCPYIMSSLVVGFIWKFLLTQGFASLYGITKWGFLNWSWLGTSQLAFSSIVIVSVWQSIGFYVVIYLAGLQSVPVEVMEAAAIDGAVAARGFFAVKFPLLGPSITVCMFMSFTNAIKVFDVIISLTDGGPGGSTRSVTIDVYTDAFQNNMYGYGSAKALILFGVVVLVTFFLLRFFKAREVEA